MYSWLCGAPLFVRMAVFWMFVFARMNVERLNQPPCFPHCGSSHVQAARFLCDQPCVGVKPVFHRPLTPVTFTYTRDQLLAVSPSPLLPHVADAIRGVGIGYHLPRVRTHRGGRRKQRKIRVVVGGGFVDASNKASRTVNSHNLIHVPIVRFGSVYSTDLSFALFNAQSVGPRVKRSAINEYILSNSTDVLCVTETWLRAAGDEAKCRDLSPPGHTTTSFPRSTSTCGGGLAFVVSDRLLPHSTFTSDFPFNHTSFELAQLSLSLGQSHLNVFCLYRPPPSKKNKLTDSLFVEEFPDFLEYANSLKGSLLIVGDFNFHFDNPTQLYTAKILDIICSFDLCQSVSEPTHARGHIVDWVVYREEDALLKSTTVDHNLSSDHYCVLCSLNLTKPPVPRTCRQVRRLTSMDTTAFKASLVADMPSDPTADELFRVLRCTLDVHAPVRRRLVSDRPHSPWYNSVGPELLEAKRERRKAEKQWRTTGLTIHRQIFQLARNKVTDIVHRAKSAFFSTQILACTTSKQLFGVANNILGKVNTSPLPTMYPVHELPQKFADFFASKIALIRSKIDSAVVSPVCVPERVYGGPSLHAFEPVTEEFVKKVCLSCNPKSCELDPVPTSVLIDCLDVLLPHITHIMNTSLSSGHFPHIFKSAIVRPLLKKPSLDQNCLKNYRPVSNLSFLSKVLEKIVLSQLLDHLTQNHLLNPHQSAYRQSHSTETALVSIVNDILLGLDNDKVSILALLDLSAAFDTIDHSILLSRLQNSFGICGTALSWFQSYLLDRSQAVCVKGVSSEPSGLSFGVPQGSVLGPMLFVLYASPVSDVISHHSMSHESFADDTQLHQSAPIAEIDGLMARTRECISDLKVWMTQNKLQLNDEKTELLLACPKKFLSHPSIPTSLEVGSVTVPFSSSVRSLGVTLDPTLSFQQHISTVCRSAYFELRKISSVRHLLSAEATKTLVCAFIFSKLDYCNSLLAGLPKHLIHRLQRIQNNAARLVCRSSKFEHVSPLLHKLHWLPISDRIDYKISSLTYSAVSGTGPEYLSKLVHIYTPSRSLRSSSDTRLLRIPSVRTKTYGQRSFSYQSPTTWNTLPAPLRHSDSLTSFKTSLKTHLFSC